MNKLKSKLYKFGLLLSIPLIVASCGQGEEESEIAKKITFTTSQNAVVVQNNLSDSGQTCVSGGVRGPRVRLRSSIKWEGTGDLLPLVIIIRATDARLAQDIKGAVSPGQADSESLAFMFGLTTDYIPPGATAYPMTTCFLDYGGLPAPKQELKGTATLEVPVTIQINGVVRDSEGNDTPFVKEVNSSIIYVAGSIPI